MIYINIVSIYLKRERDQSLDFVSNVIIGFVHKLSSKSIWWCVALFSCFQLPLLSNLWFFFCSNCMNWMPSVIYFFVCVDGFEMEFHGLNQFPFFITMKKKARLNFKRNYEFNENKRKEAIVINGPYVVRLTKRIRFR